MTRPETRNNFDLLRLCAALQVVHSHAVEHLQIAYGPVGRGVSELLALFPGVPVFFVISGFLISQSYERTPDLHTYAWKRLLRIYPALWASFGLSVLLLIALHPSAVTFMATPVGWAWAAGQLSIVQFFNPAALRHFGVGVLNGSLWTIPVELQFYAALPILYGFCVRTDGGKSTLRLGTVAVASFAVWCASQSGLLDRGSMKVLQVTLAPHLFLFLGGVLLQRAWKDIAPVVANHAGGWAAAYVAACLLSRPLPRHSAIALAGAAVSFALLAVTVLALAHTHRELSGHVLHGHDYSYGTYLYHMLVVNALVELGYTGEIADLAIAFAVTAAAAAASWWIVERPALALKVSRPSRGEPCTFFMWSAPDRIS